MSQHRPERLTTSYAKKQNSKNRNTALNNQSITTSTLIESTRLICLDWHSGSAQRRTHFLTAIAANSQRPNILNARTLWKYFRCVRGLKAFCAFYMEEKQVKEPEYGKEREKLRIIARTIGAGYSHLNSFDATTSLV